MKLSLAQYADVILSLELSDQAFEEFVAHARAIHHALASDDEVRMTLLHPKTPKEEVAKTVAKATSAEFARFFVTLVAASDHKKLAAIADKVEARHDELNSQVRVTAESAYNMDKDTKQALVESLEKKLNKKVKLDVRTNAELISGLRLTIGDEVIDDTVAKRMELLAQQFTTK